jgi:hypothetical protein
MSNSTTPTATSSPSQTSLQSTPSCTTAVPGKYGYVPPDACNAYYNFNPNFVAAVVVAIIFGIFTAIHITLGIATKKVIKVHKLHFTVG